MSIFNIHNAVRSASVLCICAAGFLFRSFPSLSGNIVKSTVGYAAPLDSLSSMLVMFWNLENFFDWKDGGCGASDNEFSSYGQRHWTKSRFQAKCDAIAKALMWTEWEYGRIPDVIGVAEVENRPVLEALLGSTSLRKYGYSIVHHDSPDPRGIDVAMLYRNEVFRLFGERPVRVCLDEGSSATRDILYVSLAYTEGGGTVHFLVNHHPSKYGGAEMSVSRRKTAVETMLSVCDSIYRACNGIAGIICMGDFNDTPDNPLLDFGDRDLVNMAVPLSERGEGTIRYRGKREMIDMFIVSTEVAVRSEMEVLHIPFLTVPDNAYPGDKPFRTYSGPVYIGGVSDHCPILLKIKIVLSEDIGIFEE